MGEPGFIRQRDVDGDLAQIRKSEPMLAQILANLQHLLFAEIRYYVDRIELRDLGQCGLLSSATDEIAGVDQMLADDTVERRPDFGVTKVQLGQCELRLSIEKRCLGARPLKDPMIDLGLGSRVLLDEF